MSDPYGRVPAVSLLYDPWLHLRGMDDVVLEFVDCGGGSGSWCQETQTIRLDRRLYQAERRSVLTHELRHVAHGHCGPQPPAVELMVRKEAARLLIDIRELSQAMLWSDHIDDVAEELVCRSIDVRIRLSYLHPAERGYLKARWLAREHTA